jgi:thioredoxin-related protein
MIKCLATLLILLFALFGINGSAFAEAKGVAKGDLELLVYERQGCAWCARWDQEIAPIYPKADIGQIAPLRRISLDQKSTTDPILEDPVRFTPTFVLLRSGKEVGRITGYHNDAFFWGLLESMVERLPSK